MWDRFPRRWLLLPAAHNAAACQELVVKTKRTPVDSKHRRQQLLMPAESPPRAPLLPAPCPPRAAVPTAGRGLSSCAAPAPSQLLPGDCSGQHDPSGAPGESPRHALYFVSSPKRALNRIRSSLQPFQSLKLQMTGSQQHTLVTESQGYEACVLAEVPRQNCVSGHQDLGIQVFLLHTCSSRFLHYTSAKADQSFANVQRSLVKLTKGSPLPCLCSAAECEHSAYRRP
ncbi:uncharacterized protein LOC118171277 [Oxyura jamaicensis]|uniref:uncharacterized protein LOC118171277 n=1 Tax=Oxyura jamaicensis TaxID=8884 RepID=UPI0015A6BFB3|nr:uncharacterized protein LOC118171277 [Oxyura jamaicensis]